MSSRRKGSAPKRFEETTIAAIHKREGEGDANTAKKQRLEAERTGSSIAALLRQAYRDVEVLEGGEKTCRLYDALKRLGKDSRDWSGIDAIKASERWQEKTSEWDNDDWVREMCSLILEGCAELLDQGWSTWTGLHDEVMEALNSLSEHNSPMRPNHMLGTLYSVAEESQAAAEILERWELVLFQQKLAYFEQRFGLRIAVGEGLRPPPLDTESNSDSVVDDIDEDDE